MNFKDMLQEEEKHIGWRQIIDALVKEGFLPKRGHVQPVVSKGSETVVFEVLVSAEAIRDAMYKAGHRDVDNATKLSGDKAGLIFTLPEK